MTRSALEAAIVAVRDTTNVPGMCLQQTRDWFDIGPFYPDASTAWRNVNAKHPRHRNPPRGAPVFWTGGSRGFGHVAISLGNGDIRSTDAGGTGIVATRSLGWFEANWPLLTYAGWGEDLNEVRIPGLDTPNRVERAHVLFREGLALLDATPEHRDTVHRVARRLRMDLRELPPR